MIEEIYVYIIDMQCSVPEAVTLNEDGSYTVFLNARLSYERQQEAYQHALAHINDNDFYKDTAAEAERHAREG